MSGSAEDRLHERPENEGKTKSGLLRFTRELGAHGFLLPYGLTYDDTARLLYGISRKFEDDDLYDQARKSNPDITKTELLVSVAKTVYTELFEWNHGRLFVILRDRLLEKTENDSAKYEKIRQVLFAFEHGLYYPCACGLVSMIEGELGKASHSSSTKLYELIRLLKEQERQGEDEIIFENVCGYISQLARSANFVHDEEPDSINRHWLLHGRNERKIDRFDCLSLLNLYEEILVLIENKVQ